MEQLDLRVQKTYKALVEAFERLLLEKEFESISVTEICDAAMIRRPTFYKHFLDKYDFITFFIKHKMNKIFLLLFSSSFWINLIISYTSFSVFKRMGTASLNLKVYGNTERVC